MKEIFNQYFIYKALIAFLVIDKFLWNNQFGWWELLVMFLMIHTQEKNDRLEKDLEILRKVLLEVFQEERKQSKQ